MALKDLEQLQHEAVDPETRTLIAEVVKSYEAGALRAATVSLWIAVVADLTHKIRHLAESGDGEAAQVIAGLDKALANQAINKVQEYERTLLETAEHKLGMLTAREKSELVRLNEDRNLCAHPGFLDQTELFLPDAEIVRAHLVAASRAVFSQRPLAGKRLLETLETEIEATSWPADGKYFLARFFRPARESVKGNIAKVLIKNSLRTAAEGDRTAERSRKSTMAIAEESPHIFERSLESVLQAREESGALGERELVRAVGAYGSRDTFWRTLPHTGNARLKALLNECDVDFLLAERFFESGLPADPTIAETFDSMVSKMDSSQMHTAIKQSKVRAPFIVHAIRRVCDSSSFRGAEQNLRLVELCSQDLTGADIAALRGAVESNQRGQVRLAGESEAILISIYTECPKSSESHNEWKALAAWLHQEGVEKGDDSYQYDKLSEVVNLD